MSETWTNIKSNFKMDKKITKSHNLIKLVREDLNKSTESSRAGKEGLLIPSSDDLIQIEVTRQNLKRALLFMNQLIILIEEKGYTLDVNNRETFVAKGQDKIRIRFREIQKRIKKNQSSYSYTRPVPSGIVSFKMEMNYAEKEWRDTKSKTLEAFLPEIILSIEVSLKDKKERRISNELQLKEYRLSQKNKELIKKKELKELKEFKSLINSSGRWYKSQNLRNYLDTFEHKSIESNTLSETKKEWLHWARQKADWYDPFIESDDDVFRDIDRDSF